MLPSTKKFIQRKWQNFKTISPPSKKQWVNNKILPAKTCNRSGWHIWVPFLNFRRRINETRGWFVCCFPAGQAGSTRLDPAKIPTISIKYRTPYMSVFLGKHGRPKNVPAHFFCFIRPIFWKAVCSGLVHFWCCPRAPIFCHYFSNI